MYLFNVPQPFGNVIECFLLSYVIDKHNSLHNGNTNQNKINIIAKHITQIRSPGEYLIIGLYDLTKLGIDYTKDVICG